MAFRLIEINQLKGVLLRLEDYINDLKQLINQWRVKPIRVSGNRVVEDHGVYNALKSFGVKYAPVTETPLNIYVDLNELDPFYEFKESNTARVYANALELLYRGFPTPLVKLKSLSIAGVDVWAKLEWYNPFSLSVKDRIAWYMLKNYVEENGARGVVYELSSGNTGLSLACLSKHCGLRTKIFLPNTSPKLYDTYLRLLNAEVVRVNCNITVEARDEVVALANRDGAVVLDQFSNDNNFIVHLRYTAKELDYQLTNAGLTLNAVVSGLGTSGHLSALSLYFKNRYPRVLIYGVVPKVGSTIPGLRRVETGMKWLKIVSIDGVIEVSEEEAFEGVKLVADKDGLIVGLSSGAIAYSTLKLIEKGVLSGNVVIFFPDHGFKYHEYFEKKFRERTS